MTGWRGGRRTPAYRVGLAPSQRRRAVKPPLSVDDRIAMLAAASLIIFVAMVCGAITVGFFG